MFRILKFLFVLTIGVYLGFQLSLMIMRSNCTANEGTWADSVCVVPEGAT